MMNNDRLLRILFVLNVLQLLFLAYKFNYSIQIDRDVVELRAKVEAQSEMLLQELKQRTDVIQREQEFAEKRYE